MTDISDFFDDLGASSSAREVRTLSNDQQRERASIVNGGETTYELIPCPKCGGRGSKTYGYVNIQTYPCKLCKATGKVTGKRLAAVAAWKKGLETKEKNLRERTHSFQEAHKAEVEFLRRNSEWSDFYRALWDKLSQFGFLTDNQLAAVQRGIEKAKERQAQRAVERAVAPKVDVSGIEALFDKAMASRLKKPVFRGLDGIQISRAPASSKNAGALYVKENGEYAGKIMGGAFLATRAASEAVLPRLLKIAADPLGEATMYGKQTGICCCCGAELTNKLSIELGIGPICRGKWGL